MAKEYAVHGATLECKMGDSKSKLKILPTRKEKLTGKRQANIGDAKPFVNVPAFGKCKSMINPAVASATAACNGKLQPMPCTPACSIWIGGKPDHMVEKMPALMKGDKAVCPLGAGMIKVTDSGQGSGKKGASNPPSKTKQGCGQKGEPVDAIHGYVFYSLLDFEYPGVIPLSWERNWNSGNTRLGALGYGTGLLYTMYLRSDEDEIVLVNDKGQEVYFEPPWEYEPSINRSEKLSMTSGVGFYEVFDYEKRMRYIFKKSARANIYRLEEITDETRDHKIAIKYDRNNLSGITDTAGRYFEVKTNNSGQVTQVRYDGKALVEYAYDSLLNLVEATDVNGAKSKMYYKNHLLVKRITKNGDAFYWEYENTSEENKRCIHTWGDGGLLEGRFDYHDDCTVFTNSLSDEEIFYFDDNKQLARYIDANKAETLYTYTQYGEIESVTNPDGETTQYDYNDFGQIIEIELPTGAIRTMEYDDDFRLIKNIAPNGAIRTWEYDAQGRVIKDIMPAGVETEYTYNGAGMLAKVIEGEDENRRETEFRYDEYYNPCEAKYPNGAVEKWEYDKSGNCIKAINPLGAISEMVYDKANRIVRYTAGDGGVAHLAYNATDDVIHFKDNDREISFSYSALGELTSRTERNRSIKMNYDTEGRISRVENEVGEEYIYKRDGMGNTISEIGYDGVVKSYEYSPGGKLTGLKRGETSGFTNVKYGVDGLLSEIQYENGDMEVFIHDEMGQLLSAENKSARLEFEYDITGMLIKETQNGIAVESEYSADFVERTKLKTGLGLDVDIHLNAFGQATEIIAGFKDGAKYQSSIVYNELEQITQRVINTSGGCEIKDVWSYDKQGRPLSQSINIDNHESRRRQYCWEPGDKLKSIIDSISGIGLEYSYDSYGIPEVEKIKGVKLSPTGQTRIRHFDNAGNVYETQDCGDRKYSKGGQLAFASGCRYRYNDCGDLIEKIEPDGNKWSYTYHPSGALEKVLRPDGKEVSFDYDPLGRRVSKNFDGKITKFLWDGDKIVHEWAEKGGVDLEQRSTEVFAWLSDEDGVTPFAKLSSEDEYTVISNHLGTPGSMINQKGGTVWNAELDLFGKPFLKESLNADAINRPFHYSGKYPDLSSSLSEQGADLMPIRFPGQYEDSETELYYNRFRYYMPDEGIYTGRDPISLSGGNPTIYGYVWNTLTQIDLWGLTGTYIFTNGIISYIGKGPIARMGASMRARIGGKGNATLLAHMDFGDDKLGFMVEHRLMEKYKARTSPNFANSPSISSPGKKLYESADAKTKRKVDKLAEKLDKKFRESGKGCKK